MEQIVEQILAYKSKLENRERKTYLHTVSRKEFTFLLSGLASFRKVPGITKQMSFKEHYHCNTEADKLMVKNYLKEMFSITDKETLVKACYVRYSGSREYEQFMTFWKNAPLFELSNLNPDALRAFEMCKEKANHFYPLLQEKGFYAWDFNERINLCRIAVACDMITEEEFEILTDAWVRLAQVFYHSYEEYAISCLCGVIYFMARFDESNLESVFDLNSKLLDLLLYNDGEWNTNAWYQPKEREMIGLLERDLGCIISKKALDNNKIGFMYRAEPFAERPDSGWRFLYGDETQEDLDNTNNSTIVSINQVCNIQPDILAYMYAKAGSKFKMTNEGWIAL